MQSNHRNHQGTKPQRMKPNEDPHKPKIVRRNYHVTASTAYNIRKLAMESNTSEGRIIDKLIRNYLAEREFSQPGH